MLTSACRFKLHVALGASACTFLCLSLYVSVDLLLCLLSGNRVPIGGHCVTVRASRGARVLRVQDEGDGVYSVHYVVRAPRELLLNAQVEHLRLADTVANLLTYEQQLASDALVQECMVSMRRSSWKP